MAETWGDDSHREIRLTVDDLMRPVQLSVSNTSGEIIIRAEDRTDVAIVADRHGRTNDVHLSVKQDGNTIEIRQERNGAGWLGGIVGRGSSTYWDIAVAVPRSWSPALGGPGGESRIRTASGDVDVSGIGGDVEITTASGNVEARDLFGTVTMATASGDVSASRIIGDVRINTASGEIHLDQIQGDLTMRSASGDYSVASAALTSWSFSSASGELDLAATLAGTGPYRAQTASGDISLMLALPPGGIVDERAAAYRMRFRTMSGEPTVDGAFAREDKRVWRLGPESSPVSDIHVQTMSGNLEAGVLTDPFPFDAAAVRRARGQRHNPPSMSDTSIWGIPGIDRIAEEVEGAMRQVDAAVSDLESRFGGNHPGNRDGHPHRQPATTATPPAPPSPPSPPPFVEPAEGVGEPITGSDSPVEQEKVAFTNPTTDTPDTAQDTEADRLAILLALERGELSIEDAMSRLDGLGGVYAHAPATGSTTAP